MKPTFQTEVNGFLRKFKRETRAMIRAGSYSELDSSEFNSEQSKDEQPETIARCEKALKEYLAFIDVLVTWHMVREERSQNAGQILDFLNLQRTGMNPLAPAEEPMYRLTFWGGFNGHAVTLYAGSLDDVDFAAIWALGGYEMMCVWLWVENGRIMDKVNVVAEKVRESFARHDIFEAQVEAGDQDVFGGEPVVVKVRARVLP